MPAWPAWPRGNNKMPGLCVCDSDSERRPGGGRRRPGRRPVPGLPRPAGRASFRRLGRRSTRKARVPCASAVLRATRRVARPATPAPFLVTEWLTGPALWERIVACWSDDWLARKSQIQGNCSNFAKRTDTRTEKRWMGGVMVFPRSGLPEAGLGWPAGRPVRPTPR